jgi:hypothetical protein
MEEVEMYEEVLLSLVDNEIIQAGVWWSVPNLTLSVAKLNHGVPAIQAIA